MNVRRPHQNCLLDILTVVPGATTQKDAPILPILLFFGILIKLDTIELTPKQYAEKVRILLHNIFHVTRCLLRVTFIMLLGYENVYFLYFSLKQAAASQAL